ncbi:MAG TPA: metallophosphoesterase, partial [Symbiobacteriaceae bacterium]|nr:metallophosphoesterase [Symbiobacteriaceae bacterium]
DIHMSSVDSAMANKLHTALQDITRMQAPVDTIVLGGDLVDGGRERDYQRLSEVFAAYKLPKRYGLMGNHEYYDIWYNASGNWSTETGPNGKTDAQARERFLRYMGYGEHPYADAWINGIHLIMLSQEAYVQERPEVGEGAWYSDAQLAWLEEIMRPHAGGTPAFVFIHQPLPPEGSDGGSHRLIRAKEFRSILRPYRNVFVLSGHTHRNLETEGRYVRDTTFHWFNNASVGKTRSGGSVTSPVQGLYIQVFPDRVVVRGREFSNRTWIKVAEWTVELL